ncbi:hypothetical protein SELMODRAFT_439065 [Selaginella moellendorffii]|uniref:Uncharacterized protein n=1 Tax=Selaginella moellendorffii TaxID=88036 RepID=D8R259_SELML|nr:uncharacterized protein LOC9660181 [Selaginella moellendorffii]EFJ34015.1 hypothetical protein SELMODRAFT_439065 [Selaginella moellendorffii]|eukprot:XP_002965177.1 uncharacterized protein LOC9660181 [Selaginella moellendorffii]
MGHGSRRSSRVDPDFDDWRSGKHSYSQSDHPSTRRRASRRRRRDDDRHSSSPRRRTNSRSDDGMDPRPRTKEPSSRDNDGMDPREPSSRMDAKRSRSPERRPSGSKRPCMEEKATRPCTEEVEDEAIAGWAPIPGKIHPAIGLNEVEAKKYGFFPAREKDTLLDEDGMKSDLFYCDKAAYQVFNDARLRGTELGAWVEKRLGLGVLFVHHNYDNLPGWRVITLFGRHKAALPTRGKKIIPEWLKVHGEQDDAECVASAMLFAEAATGLDVKGCSLNKVFVSGNTKFVELLRKDYAGLQELFVQRLAVDRPRHVPFRVWHVTSQSCSQAEEECFNESRRGFSYQGEGWACLRGIGVPSTVPAWKAAVRSFLERRK